MIFLAKGVCRLGFRKFDKGGNIVEEHGATFTEDPNGGSVAVGKLDDAGELIGQPEVFGDYDPAGYLSCVLRLLAPCREGNIPDFESIFKRAYQDHHREDCPALEYCERGVCSNCIVHQWMEEVDEGE